MRWPEQLRVRVRMLFRRTSAAAQLDKELQYHLDNLTQENVAAGMAPQKAREAALRVFGNPALVREQAHATWNWNRMEGLARDVRHALGALRRTPGFSAIAVMVVALGIGANVSLFTVVRGVILKPLPFEEPGRLLMLYEQKLHEADAPGYEAVAAGMYSEWKKQNDSFTSLALARESRVQLSGTGGQLAEKLYSGELSWDFLPTIGVQPALGHNFTQADDSPSAAGRALLSWSLWKRRFGGDANIVNRTVYIDARPFTVAGVMPAWFEFPDASTQLWLPISHERSEQQMRSLSIHRMLVVGRLKPGVSEAQAEADLTVISRRVHDAHLNDPFIFTAANARPLMDHMVGDMKRPLLVLLAATGCVLLIACLNVANLLVARAAARRRDLAIRAALGGGWRRLMRERVMESLLLSVFGGVLGVGFAKVALMWLVSTRQDINRVDSIGFDGVIAAFTVAIILLCALMSGLVSLSGARRESILDGLREGSRAFSGDRGRTRLRRVLLSMEVGLTVVLLIGAGLLMKSYERLRTADMGCLTTNVLTMHTGLPDARYPEPAQRVNFYDTLLQRIRALPGVRAAGFIDAIPGNGSGADKSFTIVEHPALPQGKGLSALDRTADPGYFETMGIPMLRGRLFNPALRLKNANEVVIDQLFAEAFFPGEEPLGKHIQVQSGRYVITGVVGSTRFDIGEKPQPMLYLPLAAGEMPVGNIVIRSDRDVSQFALPVQRIVAGMDSDLAISDVLTMDQLLGQSTLGASFNATLLVGFATLSLVLAGAGLFGVLSYIAAQRTGEIGIRIALGAGRGQVLRLMLMDGMRPALMGLCLGLAASVAVTRLVRNMLYETPALDPAVFAGVAALLVVVAMMACLLPAWRASRLDAIQALRMD